MWNLSALMPLSERYPSLYSSLFKSYDKSTHGVVFAWLRDKMPWHFPVNIKNSSEQYLRLTYYTEEIFNVILDRWDLEIDVEAIDDSFSQSEGSRFWD